MRANLLKLYSLGFNYWKYPLYTNKQFLNDVIQMINIDKRVDYAMGNDLVREQSNFIYRNAHIFYIHNCREEVIQKRNKILYKGLPELLIFNAMKHFKDKINFFKSNEDYQ